MKFRILKEAFQEGLQQVQHVVSARTTLPILSNVLVEAEGDALRLTTTDLDVGVSVRVDAKVEVPGGTTLPARRLASIIRELPASDVDVEVDDKNTASIRSGRSFFKILGLNRDEFPPLPDFEDAHEFKLDQKRLLDCLKKTSYAISTDETRYVLNGIFFSFKEGSLTMVATDGRRLAMVEQDVEFPQSQETDMIIPTKAVNELQRLLHDEGEVTMLVGTSQVAFELNQSLLVSKLIEGNYPNFRQVIPGDLKHRITIEREALLSSVSRVAVLSTDKSHSIKLHFGEDDVEIISTAPEIGEARENLPIDFKGDPFTIAFNPEFMIAPLRNLEVDEVYLDLTDDMCPGVMRTRDTTFLYVLMPMRVTQ